MSNHIFEVKNIHYSAGKKEILRGINFKIKKGEIHAIIGVNGTGKTTLANIITGLKGYKPSQGKIIFNGKDITHFSIGKRAKMGITLAWQTPAVFEGITVEDYLSIKDNGITPKEALDLVGLNPKVYLSRIVDENLSGGERKRIELASVFAIKPKLAILDEPDSGIDIKSIKIIKKIIKTFKGMGVSVILITHNEKIAKLADRISLFCNGKVVKEGNVKEVINFFKKHCERCKHVGQIDEEILK